MTPRVHCPASPHRSATRLGVLALASALTCALAPMGVAEAKLIPPAGVWPTNVVGAANPLTGTPFIYNGGHASGTPSFRLWVSVNGKHRKKSTRTIGGRVVIRGRLRNPASHRSISGATVVLAAQSVYAGTWHAIGNYRTNRKGRFRAVLPVGGHIRIGALYYPVVNSASPVFSRRVLVRARSRVWLGKPYRNGHRFRFDGKVSGAAIPSSGLLIALQIRNRQGNWVNPRLARTNASGRFRIRYRFPRRGRLTVRVRVPSQTAWPLYGNTSQNRRVRPR